jgi:ABC-type transport system involved in multi-copper enzyme maturation permease subunit
MFAEFFRFDLRHQLRTPLLWVAGFIFALLAFAATSSDVVTIGGSVGNVHRNAPAVIVNFLVSFSVLGLFIVTFFVAHPLLRDFELGSDELFFSTPMRSRDYIAGRLAAGLTASLAIYLLTSAGLIIGGAMPWIDPQRLGPFSLEPHVWSFAVIVIPNLIFMTALLSLLAVTTRSLLSVYLGVIGFFVLWAAASYLARDIRYDDIAALVDPFGARALERTMRYWSANESNTLLPSLDQRLLINRAMWLAISAALFTATFALFRPQRLHGGRKRARRADAPAAIIDDQPILAAPTHVRPAFHARAVWAQFLHQLRFDAAGVLRSVPFLVLLAFGVANLVINSLSIEQLFGARILPVTDVMLRAIEGSYAFLLILIVGFYAGDLVWRERSAKLAELTDALPTPNWIPLLAKTGALFAVILAFMLIGMLTSVVVQLLSGYTNLQLGLYLSGLAIEAARFMFMAVLAIVLQVISNNKVIGYLLFVLVMVVQIALPPLHLEHNLYNLAGAPATPHSDMNGYGHFIKGWAWFELYWALFAAILVILASAFWVRGAAPAWRGRLRQARQSLRGAQTVLLTTLASAFVAVGVWIFYNTNVLNEYLPADVVMDRQAHYEKAYRQFNDAPQPQVVAVNANVDIYPAERRVAIRGSYKLENRRAEPIADLHLTLDPRVKFTSLQLGDAELISDDPAVGYRLYRLKEPLQPGASMDFTFAVERAERGFTNDGMPPSTGGGDMRSTLNYNGTFFNSMGTMPHFGYSEGMQLIDRTERRKRGLGDVPRMPKLEDESARRTIGLADADWIDFETTVSTSADQIALAPGYLQREWTENGRRYFHYKMDRPMLAFYCFLSARWDVKRDVWNGVPIEIYYDPQHPYNVDRMIYGVKKSLDYFTKNFSPYQHRQVRILEFPRYARFAQSFANTIPYSEAIGFVADLRDPETLDYVFYVTAHEMAHQWWAHQVIGANMQGQSMLSESLAQYSALMVMEHEYGREKMRKFLKYELDRYLRDRGGELVEELPLMRVEDQPYIHYQKGSLVFYRLRDEIGEENLNRALSNFIRDKAFQQAPFTTTREFMDYLRAESPPETHALLDDLFAKIIFYDNRVTSATAQRRPDGKFDVRIDFDAAKREANGEGAEIPLPVNDWIDVGVFTRASGDSEEKEKVLYLQRHHVTAGAKSLTVVVDEQPYEVGVDPYNKLIDRIPDDNRKTVD